jgi:hypothetical protein
MTLQMEELDTLKENSRTAVHEDKNGLIVEVDSISQRPILIGDSRWDFARIRYDYPEMVPLWAKRFVQRYYMRYYKILNEV